MAGLPYAAIRNNRGVAVFKSMPHGPDCVNLRNPDPRLNSGQTAVSGTDTNFNSLNSQVSKKFRTLKSCRIATDQFKISKFLSKLFHCPRHYRFIVGMSYVYDYNINPGFYKFACPFKIIPG